MNEPTRTAAATAARRRQSEEQRAAYLRERGWTCTPPGSDGPGALCAVIRDDAGEQRGRVIIAPDGIPPSALDVFRLDRPMPRPVGRAEQQRAQLADVERELVSYGYAPQLGWVFGVDARGPYASVAVRWIGRGDLVATPDTRDTITGHRR